MFLPKNFLKCFLEQSIGKSVISMLLLEEKKYQ